MNVLQTWFQEFDILILNGLPVTVRVKLMHPDESCDIPVVEDWNITAINGKPTSNAEWLHKKIGREPTEEDNVSDLINEQLRDAAENHEIGE